MHVFLGYPFAMGSEYREHIRAVCSKRHFQVRAADDNYAAENIWENIQHEIESAWYTIFELTGANKNVLLELGYALREAPNDVILLLHMPPPEQRNATTTHPFDYVPSDIASLRRIEYSDPDDLEKKLLATLDNLKRNEGFEDQFWMIVRAFLKEGPKTTKQIAKHVELDLPLSGQSTRNPLEELCREGQLAKEYSGRESLYSLSRYVER